MSSALTNFLVIGVALAVASACGASHSSGPPPGDSRSGDAPADHASSETGAPPRAAASPGNAPAGETPGEAQGAAECEALVSRVTRCQGLADDVKQAFARSAALWAKEAKSSAENRAAADADCRETAASMRSTLADLGC